jgi:hypothetical protein
MRYGCTKVGVFYSGKCHAAGTLRSAILLIAQTVIAAAPAAAFAQEHELLGMMHGTARVYCDSSDFTDAIELGSVEKLHICLLTEMAFGQATGAGGDNGRSENDPAYCRVSVRGTDWVVVAHAPAGICRNANAEDETRLLIRCSAVCF